MGISIQRRRGTTTQTNAFTGQAGEITIDTTKWVAVVHDGATAGGVPLAKEVHSHSNATDSTSGFMSGADKTKLDGIAGGTVYYQIVQSNGADQTQRNKLNLSGNFTLTDDGAGNRTTTDLSDSGVSSGTYTKLTVNSKGRVTVGANITASDVPTLTSAKISDLATTVQGYRLDQFAVPTADLSVNSHKLINVAEPTASTDAATKNYVDNIAVGLYFKAACRAASIANINLSAPGSSIDTVTLSVGDRVLAKDQSTATENGIYVFNGSSSAMTRALDADNSAELKSGTFIFIGTEGSANGDTAWVLSTTGTITIGTTNITFVQFSAGGAPSAGNGLQLISNVMSVKTVSSARIAVGAGGVDLATTAVTPGSAYNTFTVDAYGRITAASTISYQASATNLNGLTSLASTGIVARTGSGTFSARTIQAGTGIAITNGDGVSGNIGVAVTDDASNQRVKISKGGTPTATRPELNLIEGTGIAITETDNSGANRVDVTIAVTGGGGGAPASAQYVVLANDGSLTNERALVAGTGISLTDGGANSNLTLALQTDLGTVP